MWGRGEGGGFVNATFWPVCAPNPSSVSSIQTQFKVKNLLTNPPTPRRRAILLLDSIRNYDIEKRVENLGPERSAEVRKQMDRTGIRITVVTDMNVAPMDITELDGARFRAFGTDQEPEWELSVLSACRNFNIHEVSRLLGTDVPKPTTFGHNRTGLY